MLNDKMTKNILMVMVIVVVVTICATIIIKSLNNDNNSQASNNKIAEEEINYEEKYGVDLSKEEEYEIKGKADMTKYKYGLLDDIEDGVILYAWCWSFKTIEENLAEIATAGYSAVLTSPVTECINTDNSMKLFGKGKWDNHLQVTDYKIGNYQLGTKEELESLCKSAEKYGIKIMVDVIANQVTDKKEKISQSLIDAAGGINSLIHISGFSRATSNTRLAKTYFKNGLGFDVNTENPAVQKCLIEFLKECIDCGVDGFKFSAADNIALPTELVEEGAIYPNDFWPNIISAIKTEKEDAFIFGEMTALSDSVHNTINPKDYEIRGQYADIIGHVSAPNNSNIVKAWINDQRIGEENMYDFSKDGTTPDKLVTFVEDYHTYIAGNYKSYSNNQIKVAWAVMAARGKTTPVFFSRPQGGGAKNNWYGSVNQVGAKGDSFYVDTDIVAINKFRNAMVGEDEVIYNPDDTINVIVIERGDKGVAIINASSDYHIDIPTKLSEGLYQNQAEVNAILDSRDGRLTGVIPADSIVVIYDEKGDKMNIPMVSVTGYGNDSNFYTDDLTVTLQAINTTESTFSFGGKSYKYEKGKKITFGKNMDYDETAYITLTGKSQEGMIVKQTFPFTKKQRDENEQVVFFQKPDNWNKTIYIYFYADGGQTKFMEWPGFLMDDIGNGMYTYSITQKGENILVIFSDGKNQYPDTMSSGMNLEAGRTYKVTDTYSTIEDEGTD
ncbi:MAG: starch-binding protein [Lachnospiraceae bacterium]|nr:starch-binding protein [Lachnospiraceae bacterium]